MSQCKRLIFIIALLFFSCGPLKKGSSWQSKYVQVKSNGSLYYIPDRKGNIIPDFSRVGYHQGNQAIPNVPVEITVHSVGEDSSQQIIQDAIDRLAVRKPNKNGFRGTILLKKGRYNIPGTIRIDTGGIILRGEGDGKNGTTLVASGRGKRTLVAVSGRGNAHEIPETRHKISDDYVPVGAKSFHLDSVEGLKPSDQIIVFRPGTADWISDLKMDQIRERPGTRQWQPGNYDLKFERVITKIEDHEIFIDNPVVMAMNKKYGGGEVYKYTFEGRIKESGVENICFESAYESETDEDHGWIAIRFDKIENGWIRKITARNFGYAAVYLGRDAKQITVSDSQNLDPKSQITGGRRYSFTNTGQLNLFMNLKAVGGRHDYVTGSRVLGPNVFYNCTAENAYSDIGPHHRWAVGTLFDNIITDGTIDVQDRGNWGSGHGWAGVTQVVWHCKAQKAAVQNPWVSGKNYCIGFQGEKYKGRLENRPDGEWEGGNKHGLKPVSLYQAQLKARRRKGRISTQ